ncbi:MAG: NAD(P)/FAD-dependent oxidoreductase [Chloroflexi bacterium]|nr:NAD(P)/FAD-dependent oxidoreductase [Chloroflexota bacterium]
MSQRLAPKASAADTLGVIGLPAPITQLAAQKWDAIVIGAGHNGLTCAAYLARAGKRVLVFEARERIGGACTLEEPWPGYRISPCAYLAGLLHPLVIEELNFPAYGYHWTPASAGMFVPFDDGSSIQFWDDDDQCDAEIARFAPQDLTGWRAMTAVKRRARNAIRPPGEGDMWIGRAPTRAMIEERLQGDQEAINLLFEWSMVEYIEHYLQDERLQYALLGQGVIGTNASPHDPGTASIHFHHASGRLGGMPGMWGYVKGGMGMVSFILCDIARDAGAVIAAGLPVAQILPGEGVELMGGERIYAPIVVSNADPQVTLRMLGAAVDPAWQAQVAAVPITGCTVKINVALHELPNFTARPGTREPHHFGQINIPLTKQEWKDYPALAQAGQLPPRLWTELYFQTAHDASVAPQGMETMSVFAQYVPYTFAEGSWATRRDEVGRLAIASIARHCSNLPDAIAHIEVMGPPDIEQKVGLTGGHIFQGECLPDYMWSKRLSARTPMPGVFLCGACTHPGGSVIAMNGRNAAMEILQGA